MIEQKFLAAQDGPINILNYCALLGFFGFAQHLENLFFLGLGRVAGKRTEVSFFHELFGCCFVGEQFFKLQYYRFYVLPLFAWKAQSATAHRLDQKAWRSGAQRRRERAKAPQEG